MFFVFDLHLDVVSSFHFWPSFCCCVFICGCSWFCCCSSFTFSFRLPRALQSWVGILYLQAFFTLCSFTDILTCVYQHFPGSRQFFLEVCRASYWSSKRRPGACVCLIHSNPQTSCSARFSFKFYYVLAWTTCGESLIYLLLSCFELFLLVQSIYKDY